MSSGNGLNMRTGQKSFRKNTGEIAQNEQFHLFPQCFLSSMYLKISEIATFQLWSAASLNLAQFLNGEWVNLCRQPYPLVSYSALSE